MRIQVQLKHKSICGFVGPHELLRFPQYWHRFKGIQAGKYKVLCADTPSPPHACPLLPSIAPPSSPPATILAQAAFNEWGQCYAKFGLLHEGQPDVRRVCVKVCVKVCLAECVSLHPAESLTCANICLASRPHRLSVFFADCVCLCGCMHVYSA